MSGALTVDWQVSGSDTLDGTDFGGALPGGKVTFANGETTKTITVSIAGDQTIEADETFSVQLSNPTVAAALVTDTAFGVILNDDPAAPQITLPASATALVGEATAITGLTVADGNSATVTVSLDSRQRLGVADRTGHDLGIGQCAFGHRQRRRRQRHAGHASLHGQRRQRHWRHRRGGIGRRSDDHGRLRPARHLDPVGAGEHAAGPPDRGRGRLQRDLRHQRRRYRQRHPDSHPDPNKGTVSVTQSGTATVTSLSGNRVQITGTTADVNAVLASLEFTAEKNALGASLLITTSDGDDRTVDDSDLLSIDVVSSPESATVTAQTVVAGTPQAVTGLTVGDFDTRWNFRSRWSRPTARSAWRRSAPPSSPTRTPPPCA